MLALHWELSLVHQFLLNPTQLPGCFIHLFLAKVWHVKLTKGGSGEARGREDKQRLAAHDYQKDTDVKLATLVERGRWQVTLHNHFLEDCDFVPVLLIFASRAAAFRRWLSPGSSCSRGWVLNLLIWVWKVADFALLRTNDGLKDLSGPALHLEQHTLLKGFDITDQGYALVFLCGRVLEQPLTFVFCG